MDLLRLSGVGLALIAGTATGLRPAAAQQADATAKPFLHKLFTDNMVLQRDVPDPVWGWATPGQAVTIKMDGKSARAVAAPDGQWMTKLGPFKAGGPYTLTVAGPQTVTLHNVLVGDVWICSGQSNMEFGIANSNNAQQEIANANYPMIRLYTVPKLVATEPQSQVNSQWLECNPTNVSTGGWGGFSAVGYFFGRDLYRSLNVPIGLIHTSWGGTIAEAWTSEQALQTMPDFRPALASLKESAAAMQQGTTTHDQQMAAWYAKGDPGSANGLGYADTNLNAAAWKTMNLPTVWEDAGLPNYDGVVWFRKEFDLPADWAGKDVTLHLGPVDDQDTTWVNGMRVGGLDNYLTPRDYKVPAGVLKAGRNVIAVRVLDTGGGGGIYGKPEQMKLEAAGVAAPISLAGAWQYEATAPLTKMGPPPGAVSNNPNVVTVLYNGMIAPLVPFAIKGAIWYQGESNAGRAMQYRTLLPTMIKDWRSRFGVGNFPFFIVQLANFMQTKAEPGDSGWAELREAQLLTAQGLPNAGIAAAQDIGDANDIHPKDKQEVGRRLALNALAIAYGQPIEYSGPVYRAMQKNGNEIRLTFDHVGGGLVPLRGDKLQGFAIAGADKKFVWADARIDGNTVVVSSPAVTDPVAVRYAWADNPLANLYNKTGLPSLAFRTDSPP